MCVCVCVCVTFIQPNRHIIAKSFLEQYTLKAVKK